MVSCCAAHEADEEMLALWQNVNSINCLASVFGLFNTFAKTQPH